GADHAKIFMTGGVASAGTTLKACVYTREEVRAAVEEAERVGKYAAAHAHGGPRLRMSVEEGVATIEHGALATDDSIALMKERHCWLVCTFSIFLHPNGIEQGDGKNPAIMEKMRWARRVVDETFPGTSPPACASRSAPTRCTARCRSRWRRWCGSASPR